MTLKNESPIVTDASHSFDVMEISFEDISLDHFLLVKKWFDKSPGLQCEGDNTLRTHESQDKCQPRIRHTTHLVNFEARNLSLEQSNCNSYTFFFEKSPIYDTYEEGCQTPFLKRYGFQCVVSEQQFLHIYDNLL